MPQTGTLETKNTNSIRALTIAAFVSRYGISRAKTYELLKAGELRAVKAGRRTLIPIEVAEQWFRSLPEA